MSTLLASIEETIRQNKIKKIFIQSESEQGLQGITSYGGLLGTLGDLAGEKYGAAATENPDSYCCSNDKEVHG